MGKIFNTNLFVNENGQERQYLPDGYFYVPYTGYLDIKPARIYDKILVQKGEQLFAYITQKKTPSFIDGLEVENGKEIIPIYDINNPEKILALVKQIDQLKKPVAELEFLKIDLSQPSASKLANIKFSQQFSQDGFYSILTMAYDSKSDSAVFRFEENNQTKLSVFDLKTGNKVGNELIYPGEIAYIDGGFKKISFSEDRNGYFVKLENFFADNNEPEKMNIKLSEEYSSLQHLEQPVFSYIDNDLIGLQNTDAQGNYKNIIFRKNANNEYLPILELNNSQYISYKIFKDDLYLITKVPKTNSNILLKYIKSNNSVKALGQVNFDEFSDMEFVNLD